MCGVLLAPIQQTVSNGASNSIKPAAKPAAPTPPMGWNSFVTYGDSVTEQEVMANAQYMKDNLAEYGWDYVVVDYRWYDPKPIGHRAIGRANARLSADWYGRLTPAKTRFPSAVNNAGFKPLADKLHGMGLKFGIHIMRGIPRQSVKANRPIENSAFRAADAANINSISTWCPDMYGVKADTPAGQAWYDSLMRQYAAWGVDFVKVDDLTNPYSGADIKAIRKAIDKCGRSIIFSASPGPTSPRHAKQVENDTDMWRISRDFWDKWGKLDSQFDLLARWQGRGGGGRWPDPDFLPLGTIGQRAKGKKVAWQSKLTKDEQVTMMSLWAMAPAPLILGANLPDNDDWTLSLLTNKEVIDINQDAAARQSKRVWKSKGLEVWVKELADGSRAVGLFNRGIKDDVITVPLSVCGLNGNYSARDLWNKSDVGNIGNQISRSVPKHGAVLLRLSQVG